MVVVSYLAPVLDKGLVGDEAKEAEPEAEPEADGPPPSRTMVMGLGRPTYVLPMVGQSCAWA